MRQLSGLDVSMLHMDSSRTPNQVAALYTYDPATAPNGRVDFDDVLENIERRLGTSRTFRQKLVRVPLDLDLPYWIEDDAFDLEFHVRQSAVPSPGTWRQLMDVAARIYARPLDLTRPPWELYVIEGLGEGTDGIPHNGFAVLTKVHHAAVDGLSGLDLVTALHDHEPRAEPPSTGDAWRGEHEPSALALLRRAAINNAVKPWHLVQVVRRAAPSLPRIMGGVGRGEIGVRSADVPRTRFNAPVTPHRVLAGRRAALAALKAARAPVAGATVNDVVLTAVGGALRRYLTGLGELPDEPLVAVVPVSTRTVDERGTGGNQISMLRSTLATHIADPVDRLAAVTEGTQRLKKLHHAVGAGTLSDLSNATPGLLLGIAMRAQSALAARNRGRVIGNTTVTNVPGPTEPLYFCGARLVGPYGAGPTPHGVGLIHLAGSCAGEFTLSVTADREMLPDPERYELCIEESLHEIEGIATT